MHVLCAPPAFILSQDQTLLFLVFISLAFLLALQIFLNKKFLALFDFSLSRVSLLLVVLLYYRLVSQMVYCLLFNVLCSRFGTFFIVLSFFTFVNTFFKYFYFIFLPLKKGQNNKLVFIFLHIFARKYITNSFVFF